MKILIIEDEENASERLEKLIQEVAPEKRVVGKCKSIQQTLQWFRENEYPDLILSDVQLSDGLSFEIFQQLQKKVPIIFISAYDNYAIEAFKASFEMKRNWAKNYEDDMESSRYELVYLPIFKGTGGHIHYINAVPLAPWIVDIGE